MEQPLAGLDERDQQQQLQRIDQIVHHLDERQVDAERHCSGSTQYRGTADHRRHAQYYTQGDTQSDLMGRDPLSQKLKYQSHQLMVAQFHWITSRKYFYQLFAQPQTISMVIVLMPLVTSAATHKFDFRYH